MSALLDKVLDAERRADVARWDEAARTRLAQQLEEQANRLRDQVQQMRAIRDFRAAFDQHLTDAQREQRAHFEAAYRANRLRRLPTVFGELS